MNDLTPTTQQPTAFQPGASVPWLSVEDSIRPTLLAWAVEELAPFRLYRQAHEQALPRFRALNASSGSIYVYAVADGSVTLLEKPDSAQTNPNGARRSLAYLAFFREVCRFLPDGPPFHLALETGDKVTASVDVPIFAFQKRRGEASVLLPDIDFLNHDFYQAPRYQDPLAYGDKLAKAIFVGSTSGGRVTPEAARVCALPRLRAARYFDGNPRVDFLLPQIVQTSSEEAAEILRKEAFCQAAYVPFEEQLQNRFVISMDGNGATCSRVAIALKSNSVLLKYESDDLLYYFRGMQPWLDYVPVRKDADIDRILDMAQDTPAFFENIAGSGRQFAELYLSRDAVLAYTADLFNIYAACFSAEAGPYAEMVVSRPPVAAKPARLPTLLLIAHMSGRGDTTANGEGWIGSAKEDRTIEGFSAGFDNAAFNRQLVYRSLAADGTQQPPTPGGAFCGTRGKATPLHGFVIESINDTADAPKLDYEGVFRDGFASGKLPLGAVCRSPGGAPLVAMRVGLAAG